MEKRSLKSPYFLVILCTILLTGFGCSDEFFEQNAGDRITPEQHYQSLKDIEISLGGSLAPLQDIIPGLIMLDGLRSDMMDVTPYTDAYFSDINNQVLSATNPYLNTSDLYKVIINVNEVLANVDKVALKDRNVDDVVLHGIKGGLIGLRSWTYLTLVRLQNKAAYISDNMTSLPANLQQNVISKEVLLDTLINQLRPYIITGTQTLEIRIGGFPNNKALLGELFLEQNVYDSAAYYLKLACESYAYLPSSVQKALLKVDKTYKDAAWATIFLNAESSSIENLMVIPYSSTEGQYNPLATWMGYSFDYMVKPSAVLVDSFLAQVPAAGAPGDFYRGLGITFSLDTIGMLTDTTYETEAFITKYEVDKSEPFSSDIIISRGADIHLLLAEALNRMGDATSQKYALMLLNQGVNKENPKPPTYTKWTDNLGVRGRVYLKSRLVPASMTDPDSITNLIEDFIIQERAMECAFEGKRWFDLVRIAQRRGTPEYLADKVAAKFAGTPKYDEIHGILMNEANWYIPF